MKSPSLIITRLVVEGNLGCDIRFYEGLNVVAARQDVQDPRFTNTCGKTTLVELIKCAWGKQYKGYSDFPELGQVKDQVERLWLEVYTNKQPVLIERSFSALTGLMRLRWCTFDERHAYEKAHDITPAELSPIMLDRLGIPEVSVKQADGTPTKLSFPLLQRAFILHQEDSFFAVLDKVEPVSRRTQIIGFLSKIRSLESFELEPKVGEVQQRYEELEHKIERVEGFLLDNGIASLLEATQRHATALGDLQAARQLQEALQRQIRNRQATQATTDQGRVEKLRARLLTDQAEQQALTQNLIGLNEQESELSGLLGSLSVDRKKLRHIRASSALLSTVEFKNCPRCLQQVTIEMRQREDHGRCSVCGRTISRTSDATPRATPNEDDLVAQVEEAQALLIEVRSDIKRAEDRIGELRESVSDLGRQLDRETEVFVSPALDRLVGQADQVAQLTATVARAQALKDQAAALDKMREEASRLNERLKQMNARLALLRVASAQQVRRLRDELLDILTQVKFPNLKTVDIDDETLMPLINGHSYEGEGTGLKGVVVVCYHLALLKLARTNETFFPAMLVIDSPAVGDLNDVNHTALLEYIAKLNAPIQEEKNGTAEDSTGGWQIILTTRRMIPALEPLVVENLYAPDRMLLRPHNRRGTDSERSAK